jgi:hypothetical protein
MAAPIPLHMSPTHAGSFASNTAGSSTLDAILIISGNTGCHPARHVHDAEGNPGASAHQNLPSGHAHVGRSSTGNVLLGRIGSRGWVEGNAASCRPDAVSRT